MVGDPKLVSVQALLHPKQQEMAQALVDAAKDKTFEDVADLTWNTYCINIGQRPQLMLQYIKDRLNRTNSTYLIWQYNPKDPSAWLEQQGEHYHILKLHSLSPMVLFTASFVAARKNLD